MDRELDYDISRADMMTPFSLSLAAEKAIESAKRQLDAMDERLLKARMAMARAQRTSTASTTTTTTTTTTNAGTFFTTTAQPVGARESREQNWERKAVELKRLKDDLKALRSKMNVARGLDTAIDSTPPRPRRPVEGDGHQVTHDRDVIHAFPMPPSPTAYLVPMSPVCVDAPFSPRPYSSQSILPPFSEADKSLGRVPAEGYHTPPHSSPSSILPWHLLTHGQADAPDTPQSMNRISPTSVPRPSALHHGDEGDGMSYGLLARVESALSRINDVTNERKKRKLAAALAILEDSEEE